MKKLVLLFTCIAYAAFAQLTDNSFATSNIVTNLNTPWEILWGPDNKIWFTERAGTVKRVDPATKQVETLLTINDVYEESETGLLGMALHPDFSTTKPWVYLVYTYQNQSAPNGIVEKLVRYTYQNNALVSPQILLDNIKGNTTHVGSRLLFLPDKTLLMTTGEAQDVPLSQNKSSLSGKVLRLKEDGTVPTDNPTSGSLVYSYGHRNPQGLTYGNGKIYCAEHGANDNDEINIIEPDKNYGWPSVRGYCDNQNTTETNFCNANTVTEPIWSSGNTATEAVAGLDYYPSNGTVAALQNSLLMVSLKFNTTRGRDFRVYKLNSAGTEILSETVLFNNVYGRLRDICVSPAGDIYISTSNRDGRFGGTPPATDDRIIKLEYKTVTALAEEQTLAAPTIYPNPVKDILVMHHLEGQKISLVPMNGGDSYHFVVQKGEINVGLVPAGVYYLMNQQGTIIQKVVKL